MTTFLIVIIFVVIVVLIIHPARTSNHIQSKERVKMLCNNYVNGIEEQPGDQPIRVYYTPFKNAFGNIVNEMWQSHKINLSSLKFHFITENVGCIGPMCTPIKIQIHDSFMSMLWGLCYGILIKAPIRKDGTEEERESAEKLLDHSLGLLTEYSEWDKLTLPNPELHDSDPKQLIRKSNLIFWYAYNFILYHEFAHLVLGHFNARKDIPKLEKEFEADAFASKHIVDKIVNSPHEVCGKIGIVTALSSLLYTSYDVKGGSLHPDPHQRLTRVLEKLGENNDNSIWGIAIWFIIEWGMKFNAYFKLWPRSFNGDFKDAFYQSLNYLEHLQQERNVSLPNMENEYSEGEPVIHLENSIKVTIAREFKSHSAHFNTYLVRFPSGRLIFVSSDDIAREGSELDTKAKSWKAEMVEKGEKSLSIGLNGNDQLQCFFHTSNHYEIKKSHPEVKFKWAWGQPSY